MYNDVEPVQPVPPVNAVARASASSGPVQPVDARARASASSMIVRRRPLVKQDTATSQEASEEEVQARVGNTVLKLHGDGAPQCQDDQTCV